METNFVSFIFFLITFGATFFPFGLSLWGKGGENPNVFVLAGMLAMLFAGANIILVNKKSLGKWLPRALASLGLVLAGWMISYPLYQKKFCPVCFIAGGNHKLSLGAGIILLLCGVVMFIFGWKVTGWDMPQQILTSKTENS
ncbi:MAG: hypothetical protein A2142_09425 [candidate division Zixibacteria bacterium RBG_16_48_11]|nr:MAG: hypothetical protein A2142_09425 [candidate division Zixibacteria bacterium RBG_16_48_11]